MEPFLKWAGGKRWLARSASLPKPASYSRFFEPFLGSGAIFFSLLPQKAVLSDLNRELVELYSIMRRHPAKLKDLMREHHTRHSEAYYYATRERTPTTSLARAARTLYLNRTCWNGLYRVNRKGQFNVPIGTKTLVLDEAEDFHAYARALNGALIECCDFELTIDKAGPGDFVFADPPYTARHNKNGFLKYNETIFSWDDQLRLHAALSRAAERGAMIAVTNADHESVLAVYGSTFSYTQLSRATVLAGDASYRGATTEALFTANLRV
jgi:DNA adenine methylase